MKEQALFGAPNERPEPALTESEVAELGAASLADAHTEALLLNVIPNSHRKTLMGDPLMRSTIDALIVRLSCAKTESEFQNAREVVHEKATQLIGRLGHLSLV